MSDNAFMKLQDRLSEVQLELSGRAWEGDAIDRCTKAADLRLALWEAIEDYRDLWVETVKKAYREARSWQ